MKDFKRYETAEQPPQFEQMVLPEVKMYTPPIVITIDGESINKVANIDININFKED